ncbi:hypothetical protein Lal_00020643, partial [Lupinus albus]
YKRLFTISLLQDGNISDFGSWDGDRWAWNFTWRRNFFTWELDLFNSFFGEIKHVSFQLNKSDYWEWKLEKTKEYSVRSAYRCIAKRETTSPPSNQLARFFWRSKAPLKVTSFAWRLFMDRIPTKDALSRRGVLPTDANDTLCSFCHKNPESSNHLFSSCSFSYLDKKSCKFWSVVWLATVWAIWLSRNDLIFNNTSITPQHILESARVKSWLWIKGQRGMDSSTLYSTWVANPLVCLNISL